MSANPAIIQDVATAGLAAWDAVPFLEKVTGLVPNVIYIFNQQTQANEYSNRSLGVSLGYTEFEVQQMGAQMIPLLSHPGDLAQIQAHFEKILLLKDGEVAQIEYRMKHKSGNWIWLLSYDTVFDRDQQGNVIRHIGVASDITAQKQAEERARDGQARADTTNEELRAFSYSLSHDMKSPSNTLALLLSELVDTHGPSLDADAMHLIDLAQSTIVDMGSLIENVLQYTHVIEKAQAETPISLNELVRDVVSGLEQLVVEQNASVDVSDLPVVTGDPDQLQILFLNLIENAVKFRNPAVAPHIQVFADLDPSANSAKITIKDNGIGIAADKQEQVFTIFKQLDAKSRLHGRGLGLAISRRIATNHGSNIDVVSSLGKGAAFSFRLATA